MLIKKPVDLGFEVVESLADVEPSEWNRLAGRRVLASYGWLRTIEETRTSPILSRYILARNGSGLVGAIVCQIQESASEAFDLDDVLFGRLAKATRRMGLSALPALVCGSWVGGGESVLVRGGTPAGERQRLVVELVQAVERMARGSGWGVCFRGVAETESSIAEVLVKRGYLRSRELPVACLELDSGWSCFSDFRRHLKKTHPKTAKSLAREINLARRGGLVIEQLDKPAHLREHLHGLMNSHYFRLNQKPFPFRSEFFEQLKSRLDGRAVIYVARIEEELIGVTVTLWDDDAVYVPMIGVDPDRGRASAAYFNLAYNRPIQDSLAAGHRRMYFGRLLYGLKARRGCRRLDMDLYFRGRNTIQERLLRPLFVLRSMRIDSMSAALPRKVKRERDNRAAEEA
jgi:predicted N-acyltransferase